VFARLCGGQGIKVTEAKDLEDILAKAIAHDAPSLVEIITDPELV
jgi:thiamine pyrophosphate-dependent acetolactate synthase large subunit-like protein